jgi:tRNA A37 threonylcarbamoyladenosine modification protein TsaB
MYLLGIDTSGKSGGVTLAEGDEHTYRALETSAIEGGTFSAQLVPTVASLLTRRKLGIQDLGGCVRSRVLHRIACWTWRNQRSGGGQR